jgi:glycosyltransferase involved in cell wall biosynthesis
VSWDLAVGIQRRGIRVLVLTTPVPGLPASFTSDGVEVATISGAAPGRYSFRWWLGTARYPHLESGVNLISVSAGATSMVWMRRGPKYLLQTHGTARDELMATLRAPRRHRLLRALRYLYWTFLDPMTYRRVSTVVAAGERVAAGLLRWPYSSAWKRTRLRVIPNGVDVAHFAFQTERRQAGRLRFGFAETDHVGITVSRLTRQKGVDRCLAALASAGPNVKLLVVGAGDQDADLREEVGRLGLDDRVVFAGNLDHSEIPMALAAADVFVFPVRTFEREGFPVSVLEAIASGLQVIVPEGTSWPSDLLETLRFARVEDPAALGEAITSSSRCANPPVGLPQTYHLDTMVDRYLELCGLA